MSDRVAMSRLTIGEAAQDRLNSLTLSVLSAIRDKSAITTFKLFVDGKQVPSITDLEVGAEGIVMGKSQVSNFRHGLPAGVHVLKGHWWLAGATVLDSVVAVTFS